MTKELEALKPCPFCSGSDIGVYHHNIEGYEKSWHVECNADDCGNGTCHHETEGDALAAWNRRTALGARS